MNLQAAYRFGFFSLHFLLQGREAFKVANLPINYAVGQIMIL